MTSKDQAIVTIEEIGIFQQNIEHFDNFISKVGSRQPLDGSEVELAEGEMLLSFLESLLPANLYSAEIPSRSTHNNLIGSENQNMISVFKSARIKLRQLLDFVATKVEIMQLSSEANTMKSLLELLDNISELQARVDMILANQPCSLDSLVYTHDDNPALFPNHHKHTADRRPPMALSATSSSTVNSMSINTVSNGPSNTLIASMSQHTRTLSNQSASNLNQSSGSIYVNTPGGPSMASVMYMLRRMGDRKQTLSAVEHLVCRLCALNLSASTVTEMREAGALPTLLSALSRCTDWPDVELQIAKAIALLVALENDSQILLRSTYDILSALFMLQLKSAASSNTSQSTPSKAVQQTMSTTEEPTLPTPMTLPLNSAVSQFSDSYCSTPRDIGERHGFSAPTSQPLNPRLGDSRVLVADALSKLVFVLCVEWKRGDAGPAPMMSLGSSSTFRESFRDASKQPGDRSRPRSGSAAAVQLDASRTLETVLNVIMMITEPYRRLCYPPSSPPRFGQSGQHFNSLSIVQQRRFFTGPASDIQLAEGHHAPVPVSEANSIREKLPEDVVDEVAVILSATICCLAELPQCRLGLVTGGVLRLLNVWLEAGSRVARILIEISPNDLCYNEWTNESLKRLSELVCNCSRAVMLILGGKVDLLAPEDDFVRIKGHVYLAEDGGSSRRWTPRGSTHGHVSYEYMIGRIDAEVLSEDVLTVIVRFIAAMAASFNQKIFSPGCARSHYTTSEDASTVTSTDQQQNQSSSTKVTREDRQLERLRRSIFPKLVVVYLSQALYQLSSRMQNRADLLSSDAPQAILFLLQEAISEVQLHGVNKSEQEIQYTDMLLRVIDMNDSSAVHTNRLEVLSSNLDDLFGERDPDTTVSQATLFNRLHVDSTRFMKTVASACLDAVSFFLVDALNGVSVPTNMGRSYSTAPLSQLSDDTKSTRGLDVENSSSGHILVDALCSPSMISCIKFLMTSLPRGAVRLSALRVTTSLTEWPVGLVALFQNDIIEALLVVCKEAETAHNLQARHERARKDRDAEREASFKRGHSFFRGFKVDGQDRPKQHDRSYSMGSFAGTGPEKRRRQKSDNSECSSTSRVSSASQAPSISSWVSGPGFLHRTHSDGVSALSDVPGSEWGVEESLANLSLEETLTVTFALANFCQAGEIYAQRLLINGLLPIMLGLAESSNLEVGRQALRCISAICPAMASTPSEKLGSAKQLKAMYNDTLSSLSRALKSHSPLIQAEAVIGVAGLSTNIELHDAIIRGPLRSVISLVLDRIHGDRATRSAAEEILHNIGFQGGLEDLELISYDADVLHDWHLLRKSLQPQEASRIVLRGWMTDLFEGTNYSHLYGFPVDKHSPGSHSQGADDHNFHRVHSSPSILPSPDRFGHPSGCMTHREIPRSQILHVPHGSLTSREAPKSPIGVAPRRFPDSSASFSGEDSNNMTGLPPIAKPVLKHQRSSDSEASIGTVESYTTNEYPLSRQSSAYDLHNRKNLTHGVVRIHAVDRMGDASSTPITTRSRFQQIKMPPSTKQFAEGLLRLLPFCFGSRHNDSRDECEHFESDNDQPHPMFCFGRNTILGHSFQTLSHDSADSLRLQFSQSAREDSLNVGLDVPPPGVLGLLDIYYPSHMHQLFFMDLTSLQRDSVLMGNIAEDRAVSLELHSLQELTLSLPHPHNVNGIYFPPRQYSFNRFRRVVERVIDEGSDKRWSLAFRDDSFAPHVMTDFHSSVSETLCKCPQIVSVSFVCSSFHISGPKKMPEQTAHLGHLCGNIPPSVRFINLRGVLSSESIQALCIILKRNNFAFSYGLIESPVADIGHSSNFSSTVASPALAYPISSSPPFMGTKSFEESFTGRHVMSASSPVAESLSKSAASSRRSSLSATEEEHHYQSTDDLRLSYRAPILPSKGLLGLAITHTTFTASDIKYLLELLAVYPSSNIAPLKESRFMRSKKVVSERRSSLKQSRHDDRGLYGINPRGLRYVDLSNNKFVDSVCADILTAASQGPLEGLDLSGNQLIKGKAFLEALSHTVVHAPNISFLRQLGLSNTGLAIKAVCQLLELLKHNSTLTYLDLSQNEIVHSRHFEESLRSLLKFNQGLRCLDLSANKLSVDTVKCIYLGLLENDTLLLLPLVNNPPSVVTASDLPLIQGKLMDNRHRYKISIDVYNDQLRRLKPRSGRSTPLTGKTLDQDESPYGSEKRANLTLSGNSKVSEHSELDNGSISSRPSSSVLHTLFENESDNSQQTAAAQSLDELDSDIDPLMRTPSTRRPVHVLTSLTGTPNCNASNSIPFNSIAIAVPVNDENANATVTLPSLNADTNTERGNNILATLDPNNNDSTFKSPPQSETAVRNPRHLVPTLAISPSTSTSTFSLASTVSNSNINPIIPRNLTRTLSNNNVQTLNVLFSAPLVWMDRSRRYHPVDTLDYETERNSLVQVLTEVHRDISVCFQFATTDNLRTALSFGCRALHFSGHGHPQCLNFEDGKGGLQPVTVDQLRKLLRAGGLKLDFVFVSACHSRRTGEAFIEAGVPHVVCCKVDDKIKDSAANAFTRAFYLALFSGKTVQASFDIAREALKSSPYVPDSVLEGEKFILLPEDLSGYPDSDGDAPPPEKGIHDKPIFTSKLVSMWPGPSHIKMGFNASQQEAEIATQTAVLFTSRNFDGISGSSGTFFGSCNGSLPAPPPDFEGRKEDMYRVITTINSRRLTSLVGSHGCGKSALATVLCTYVADRAMFQDGVFYIRLGGVTSHSRFLHLLLKGLFAGPPKIAEKLIALRHSSEAFISATAQLFDSSHAVVTSGRTSLPVQESSNNQTPRRNSGASQHSLGNTESATIYNQEELIVNGVGSFHCLLVLDHLDDLLAGPNEAGTDLKFFLSRLFDRCQRVHVLTTCVESLGMREVGGFGIVENSIALGPLNLGSTLRLYAKLASTLFTSAEKVEFINKLSPAKGQLNVTIQSRDISPASAEILELFGCGYPAQVVKLACESTSESLERLILAGVAILSRHGEPSRSQDWTSVNSPFSSEQASPYSKSVN